MSGMEGSNDILYKIIINQCRESNCELLNDFLCSSQKLFVKIVNGILDGELAEITDYPYAASILVDNIHNCGGSIIGLKFILTAASCIAEYNATNLTVRIGSTFYNKNGQLSNVERIHVHPDFNEPVTLMNNVAVLELTEEIFENTTTTKIIALNLNGEINKPSGNGTIVGWGIVIKEENGMVKPYKPSEHLRVTHQPIIGYWSCEHDFMEGWDYDTMFCAGLYRNDNCVGDLGHPFIINGIQIGFASETLLLCGEYPTAYVNVTTYADFLNQFIILPIAQ